MGDHGVRHLARVVVEEPDLPVFVGRDRQGQGGMGHNARNVARVARVLEKKRND